MKRFLSGKQALAVVVFLTTVLFYMVVLYDSGSEYQLVNIFFASPDYNGLVSEKKHINAEQSMKSKLLDTAMLLIYGNASSNSRSVIPLKAKVKSLFFFDGELHINFSKEFLNIVVPYLSQSIVVDSILATYFVSYKEVEHIYIYVEYNELDTIDGNILFVYPYTRKEFLSKFADVRS